MKCFSEISNTCLFVWVLYLKVIAWLFTSWCKYWVYVMGLSYDRAVNYVIKLIVTIGDWSSTHKKIHVVWEVPVTCYVHPGLSEKRTADHAVRYIALKVSQAQGFLLIQERFTVISRLYYISFSNYTIV